jgi:hypothetical protein
VFDSPRQLDARLNEAPKRNWVTRAAVLATLFTVGCSDAPSRSEAGSERLVDHGAWGLVETPETDPFATDRGRPAVHACQDAAYFEPTPGTLEVELAYCRERYVSLHQSTRVALHAGDKLNFTLSHLLLRPLTEDVTEAYIGLAINGAIAWQYTIQILAVANSYPIEAVVNQEFPLGSDVVLHLDNHGENSYTFTPFDVVRAAGN